MKVSKKKKSYRERQNLQKIFSERRRKYTRDEVSGKSLLYFLFDFVYEKWQLGIVRVRFCGQICHCKIVSVTNFNAKTTSYRKCYEGKSIPTSNIVSKVDKHAFP